MNSIFLNQNPGTVAAVYPRSLREALAVSAGLDAAVRTREDVLREPELYAGTEYVFSTWGMPAFTEEEIARVFPSLKAVFYAAGSVQGFALPFIRRGVSVFSAWAANAVPVGEFTAAEIALSCKGFWAASRQASRGDFAGARKSFGGYPGCFEQKIGIIGVTCNLKSMVSGTIADRIPEYDVFPTVQRYADELRRAKCDLIIALTHIGYEEHNPGDITDVVLCRNTRNIDLIVGGHSHTFLEKAEMHPNKDGKLVPIVQDGCWGAYIGQIDVTF